MNDPKSLQGDVQGHFGVVLQILSFFWKFGIVAHLAILSSPGCPSLQEQRFLQSGKVLWMCV